MNKPATSTDWVGGTNTEAKLSDSDFARISTLVRELTGISMPESKKTLVQARLAKRLRALGLGSFDEYCKLVAGSDQAALTERPELISAITTNVTRFFREPHHFADLKSRVLPPLLERAKNGGKVRIWSGGCSTGQEPYTIALTILEMLPNADQFDIKILATDLDHAVLETARRGRYAANILEGVSAELLKTHFTKETEGGDVSYCIGPKPRSLISFKQLNLTAPWPMKSGFDFIFCRNVVIYFDAETEKSVFQGFAEKLPSGGRLFIGHSERINTLEVPVFESDGVTTYRKV